MWADAFSAVVPTASEGTGVAGTGLSLGARLTGADAQDCVVVDSHAETLPSADALGIGAIHHTTDPEGDSGTARRAAGARCGCLILSCQGKPWGAQPLAKG